VSVTLTESWQIRRLQLIPAPQVYPCGAVTSNQTHGPAIRANNVGLRCWRCGHEQLRIVYTRRCLGGLYRLRECLRCGTRFTTCERRLGA
jgi:hypothetical protein